MTVKKHSWVESLYQRSWEMELLISGFALILLLQSFAYLDYMFSWFDYSVLYSGPLYIVFLFATLLLPIVIIVLCIFLSINLIFRAYWIGLIGLMSRINKLPNTTQFSRYRKQNLIQILEVRKMKKHVDLVDHLGSQIFAVAILFICYFISLLVSIIILILLIFLTTTISQLFISLILLYIIGAFVFVLDNATGGVFSQRKSNWINQSYYYVYRVYRIITGYFVYEKIALSSRQNGVDQITKCIFLVFFLYFSAEIFIGVGESLSSESDKNSQPFRTVYLSEYSKKGLLARIAIDQREYKKMPIKLFVPLTQTIRHHLEKRCKMKRMKLVDKSCVNNLFTIKIDEQIQSLDWAYEAHPRGDTQGISFYIDPPDLARGQHNLVLEMPFLERPIEIKFWYYP
jgi:hypothetical protein